MDAICANCIEPRHATMFRASTGRRFRTCKLCRVKKQIKDLMEEERRIVAALDAERAKYREKRDRSMAIVGDKEE